MSYFKSFNTRLNGVYVALKQVFSASKLQTDIDINQDQIQTYYSGNVRTITPEKLKQLLSDADSGDISAMHALFYEIEEQDPHIAAEIAKRKNAVLTLGWAVVPPRDATPAEIKQTQWVHTVLSDIASFEDVMLDCLDAVGHGFAAIEIEWMQYNQSIIPKAFHWRAQSWFKINKKTQEIRLLKAGDPKGLELWENNWIIHKHKTKSGTQARLGLHRVLAWTFAFKNYAVNDLAEFLEIYGLPVRVGKYPAGATKEQRRSLLNAVASLGHNAAGVMPDNMDVEIKNIVNGQHDPYLAMIEYCERAQSKVILGGTLTSQADGASSTNALGNVHNEVRRDLLVSDAKQLAQTLTEQLIFTLLCLNFGDVDINRLPYFQFDLKEPQDLASLADSFSKIVDFADVPASYFYEKSGIPQPQKGDALLARKNINAFSENGAKTAALCSCGANHTVALSSHSRHQHDPQIKAALNTQQELDIAIDALPDKYLNSYDSAVLQVVAALRAAQSYTQAQEILYDLMPDLADSQFTQAMEQALLISDIAGINSAPKTGVNDE